MTTKITFFILFQFFALFLSLSPFLFLTLSLSYSSCSAVVFSSIIGKRETRFSLFLGSGYSSTQIHTNKRSHTQFIAAWIHLLSIYCMGCFIRSASLAFILSHSPVSKSHAPSFPCRQNMKQSSKLITKPKALMFMFMLYCAYIAANLCHRVRKYNTHLNCVRAHAHARAYNRMLFLAFNVQPSTGN